MTDGRRRWQPGSTDEELTADLEAARNNDAVDRVLERAGTMSLAQEATIRRAYLRAVDDPVALERGARLVRTALARRATRALGEPTSAPHQPSTPNRRR